jgi:phosphoribosylformylglycinamidine (FGAM) synthase-like enzyme
VANLFKETIKAPTEKLAAERDWVVSVLWDNAGVAKLDDQNHYVITGETHNSPSNMEAYGGAITGIVGVYRDPMGTGLGSKLVAGMWGFCVGPAAMTVSLSPPCIPGGSWTESSRGCATGATSPASPPPGAFAI